MAQVILATETENEQERNARMAEILKYNEEDLAATWAVFEWLRGKAAKVVCLRRIHQEGQPHGRVHGETSGGWRADHYLQCALHLVRRGGADHL
jgi:hypothetical protein